MNTRAAMAAFRREGPPGQGSPGVSWPAVAVAVTLLVQMIGMVSWAVTAQTQLTILRAEVPPGALSRIDERTAQIGQRLDRIESQLDSLGGRP